MEQKMDSDNKCSFNTTAVIEKDSALLNILNDDCLRKIFQYLTLLDLSNAAEVCVCFNHHANDAFKTKYRHVLKIDTKSELNGHLNETEAVLRNFGPLIHSLSIVSEAENHEIAIRAVRMINQRNTPALKELHLSGINVTEHIENFRQVFMKLQTLVLIRCQLGYDAATLFNQKFEKMEQATFIWCDELYSFTLKNFITKNRKLKLLVIRDHTKKSVNLIQLISQNLSNLMLMEIDRNCRANQFQEFVCNLGKLNSSKVLKFRFAHNYCINPLIDNLIKHKVPIEHMKLISGQIDSNTIKSLIELKQLKILEFVSSESKPKESANKLTKELSLLEKLYLVGLSSNVRVFQFI